MVVGTHTNARGYTSSSKGLLAKGTYERQAYRFDQQMETVYYAQCCWMRYNKYCRLLCISMHVLQLHPKSLQTWSQSRQCY
jgi:hypothetical protein